MECLVIIYIITSRDNIGGIFCNFFDKIDNADCLLVGNSDYQSCRLFGPSIVRSSQSLDIGFQYYLKKSP